MGFVPKEKKRNVLISAEEDNQRLPRSSTVARPVSAESTYENVSAYKR